MSNDPGQSETAVSNGSAGRLCSWSDLQDISIAGNHFIEHRVDEEPEKEPRNQARYDDDRKRFLSVGADAGGKRRRQ